MKFGSSNKYMIATGGKKKKTGKRYEETLHQREYTNNEYTHAKLCSLHPKKKTLSRVPGTTLRGPSKKLKPRPRLGPPLAVQFSELSRKSFQQIESP